MKLHRKEAFGVNNAQQENKQIADECGDCRAVCLKVGLNQEETESDIDQCPDSGGDKVEYTLFFHHVHAAQKGGHTGKDGGQKQERNKLPGGIEGVGHQNFGNYLRKQNQAGSGSTDERLITQKNMGEKGSSFGRGIADSRHLPGVHENVGHQNDNGWDFICNGKQSVCLRTQKPGNQVAACHIVNPPENGVWNQRNRIT